MEEEKKTNVCAIIGLVLGIIGTPILTIVFSIIGLVKSKKCQSGKGLSIIGLILGILKLLATIALIIVGSFLFFTNTKEAVSKVVKKHELDTYEGKGSTISYYKDEWEPVTLEGSGSKEDRAAIKKVDNDSNTYLMKIGSSAYSDDFSCDITTSSCQSEFISTWRDFIEEELDSKDLRMFGYVYSLKQLGTNSYYLAYDYGKSVAEYKGKYYVVVSKDMNAVLSFMTNSNDPDGLADLNTEVLEMFKKMVIEKQEDNTAGKILNEMTNWNLYKSVRSGSLGSVKSLVGGWKILDNSKEYFEFNATDFYYYKDYTDLSDNYYYGTYEVYTGKTGTAKVGVSDDKVDSLITNSNGKITENDIKTIIFKPTKLIASGEDKSSNIKNNEIKYIWIFVDHGSEGIEGQVLNVSEGNTLYFVKSSD